MLNHQLNHGLLQVTIWVHGAMRVGIFDSRMLGVERDRNKVL